MDCIDPKIQLIREKTGEDLLEHNFGNWLGTGRQDSEHVFDTDVTLAHPGTAHSFELVSLKEEELININAFNCDSAGSANSVVDSNFCESLLQLSSQSCLGTDSADLSLSPTQFNDSDTDWLLSECDGLNVKKRNVNCTGRDRATDVINSSRQGSDGNGNRRSYCVGNSNSKNAIAARDNRLKKKKYIADLEKTVSNLQVENERLREQSKKNGNTLCALQSEVSYLRKVLANQSTLSAILKNVMKTPGITLTTSFNKTKNSKSKETEKSAPDRKCNVIGCKNSGFLCDVNHEQGDSSVPTCRTSRKASKRNVKGQVIHTENHKEGGLAQKNKQPSTIDVETLGDSEISDVSTDNIRGGVCLHVSGQNVSLEFCHLCNKNAYLGIIADHSYVKL
ncbi:hypothetical protein BsWGS_14942 [Bradybaena similaris]